MNVPVLPTPALQKGAEKRRLKYLNVPLRGNSTVYFFVIWFFVFSLICVNLEKIKKKLTESELMIKRSFPLLQLQNLS